MWTGVATPLDVFDNSDPGVVVNAKQDFGPLPFVAGTQELRIPIRNSGNAEDLTVSASITEGANFSLTSSPDLLTPGSVGEIALAFDPKGSTGQFIGALELVTNDPDAEDQTIVIELRASLIDLALEVIGHDTDFLRALRVARAMATRVPAPPEALPELADLTALETAV